jgi:hypothetical protein
LGVDDSGDRISNSSASVCTGINIPADSPSSIARGKTRSERSRKRDNRTGCNDRGSRAARTVRENSRSCNRGRIAANCDHFATIASHRGWVHILGDLGDGRQSSDIASGIGWGWSWRRYRVSSGIKVDSLGSRTGLSNDLGDRCRWVGITSLGARSCSDQRGQAEEACQMNPGVHVGD